jgi:hypothetical protein
MADRVIPMPHQDEISVARTAIGVQAERFGLDVSDPKFQEFMEHEVTVKAQMMAEIRWLRNMMHDVRTVTDAA